MNYDPATCGYDGNYLFYQDRWYLTFGDIEVGKRTFWSYGQPVTASVKRLTIVEYNKHCIALERYTLEFAVARRNHDPEGEDVAISKALLNEV